MAAIIELATSCADIFLKSLKGPIIKGFIIFVKNSIIGTSIRNLSSGLIPNKCPGCAMTTWSYPINFISSSTAPLVFKYRFFESLFTPIAETMDIDFAPIAKAFFANAMT